MKHDVTTGPQDIKKISKDKKGISQTMQIFYSLEEMNMEELLNFPISLT